jgi:hypothetical protein
LTTNLTESINLLKNCVATKEDRIKRHSLLVIVSGDDDSIPICNMINIYAKKVGINSTMIGNIEKSIDPFFDIDFQRYINKLYSKNKEKTYVLIISYNEMSIKFLFSTLSETEFKEKVKTIIFSSKTIHEKVENKFKGNIISDLETLIEMIEKELK